MSYRNRNLLDLARGQPCMAGIIDICNHDPATTVSAHSNQARHGHAGALKADDCFIAWLCSSCHAELDQGRMRRKLKAEYWDRAFEATLLSMWEQGLISVRGKQPKDQPIYKRSTKILPRR